MRRTVPMCSHYIQAAGINFLQPEHHLPVNKLFAYQ